MSKQISSDLCFILIVCNLFALALEETYLYLANAHFEAVAIQCRAAISW